MQSPFFLYPKNKVIIINEYILNILSKGVTKMEHILGTIVTAMITDKNERFLFAQKEGVTFKVMDEEVANYEIGDMIEGFAYINKQDEHALMTTIPSVHEGTYDWGEVVAVQRELGVFVDVGWIGKDLVVSLDDLPAFTTVWPRKGDHLYLTTTTDDKHRMWGKLSPIENLLEKITPGSEEMHNEDVSGTIVSALKAGSYVALKDDYMGFVHPKERDAEPRLGQQVDGRVIGLRNDGVLYLSLFPRAHEVLDEDASMIYEVLKRSEDYHIPYHDKSNPDDIRALFGISKGQFKRAVGRLLKEDIVKQDQTGTYLTESARKREL